MNYNKLIILMFLNGCTYNVSMANAQGTNSDMIDDTNTPSTQVHTDMTIPSKVL